MNRRNSTAKMMIAVAKDATNVLIEIPSVLLPLAPAFSSAWPRSDMVARAGDHTGVGDRSGYGKKGSWVPLQVTPSREVRWALKMEKQDQGPRASRGQQRCTNDNLVICECYQRRTPRAMSLEEERVSGVTREAAGWHSDAAGEARKELVWPRASATKGSRNELLL